MNQTYVTLNDGNKIPQFGLGVYMIMGDEPTKETCLEALKLGYRHIDTAHAYQNILLVAIMLLILYINTILTS